MKPFATLGYTYKKYIEKAFRKLQNKINEKLTLRIEGDNYIEYSSDHAFDEDREFLDELDLAIDGKSKDPQMQTIAEVLRKSAIKGTSRLQKEENRLRYEKKEFADRDDNPEWIEAIYNLDYPKLIQLKEFYSKILSENKPDLYIQQAYICEFLGDYLSAYYCLDNAATYFYRKREYAWYFISLWNKRNVAQIISLDYFYNMSVEPSILDSIRREYDAIDLDTTLQSIPDLGNDNNQFLRDLKDFKFASDLFYDVFSNSTKASTQAEETYIMFAGLPAYEQMRIQVYDYYRYGVCNCLMMDRYRENNEIINLFVRSLLASAAAPDKESSPEERVFGSSGNIHVDSLLPGDIHLIIRYIEVSKLRKLFRQFNINIIEVSEEGKEYLRSIPENIAEVFNHNLYSGRDVFWRFLCFVSHVKIDPELAKSILRVLVNLKEAELSDNRRDSLLEFANALYEQELYEDKDLCKEVSLLTTRLIDIIARAPEFSRLYRNTIVALITFCDQGGCSYDDEDHIKLLLSEPYHTLLPSIYSGSSDGVKTLIEDEFKDWECPDTAKGYITYAELVLTDIIEQSKEIEEKALEFVKKHNEDRQNNLEKGIRSFSEDDGVENCLVNLYLSGKIEDSDKLKDVISQGNDNFSKWLIDVDGYDYSNFDLLWLKHCYPSLLKKLAVNSTVREAVIGVYKEKYSSEYIDNKTNDIVVKYFM